MVLHHPRLVDRGGRVTAGRAVDAVEILGLDMVGLDQHDPADAETDEHLDRRAAAAGHADDPDAQRAEAFGRVIAEHLPVTNVEVGARQARAARPDRSEEHTSELQSLMRTPYAVLW